MKLEIIKKLKPIRLYDRVTTVDFNTDDHEVYIDDKRVPEGLERIILAGLNAMEQELVENLLMKVKNNGT